MAADGRTSQPIGNFFPESFLQKASNSDQNRVDFLRAEQRRAFGDYLFDLRFGSIDELPKHKITHDDPNSHKYKCKLNWMTKLYLRLSRAEGEGLFGEKEMFLFQKYKNFLADRKKRDQARLLERLTPEAKAELMRIFNEEGTTAYINEIKEKYWIPTEPADIDFINRTLDDLIYSLSRQDKRVIH